jgi:HPt (histidine-containing phosphotransfer) domain-containing protein
MMQTETPHINVDLIDRMRNVFDDNVLASLLESFIETLRSLSPELDQLPRDSVVQVRCLAIKLRGTASEYGAVRLADVARTMEQAPRDSPHNVIDWRLLLLCEIDTTIGLYEQVINRLRVQPERQTTLQLFDVA